MEHFRLYLSSNLIKLMYDQSNINLDFRLSKNLVASQKNKYFKYYFSSNRDFSLMHLILPCYYYLYQYSLLIRLILAFLYDLRWAHYCMKTVQTRTFFYSIFSRIWTEYGEIWSTSPYSVRIRENTDKKKLRIWKLFTHCMMAATLGKNLWPPVAKWSNGHRLFSL